MVLGLKITVGFLGVADDTGLKGQTLQMGVNEAEVLGSSTQLSLPLPW